MQNGGFILIVRPKERSCHEGQRIDELSHCHRAPEAMVLDAIKVMAAQKKGSVLVAKERLLKECLGIVTTSQIFLEVFARGWTRQGSRSLIS